MFTKLHIEYANPADLHDSIMVQYHLRDNPVVARWVKKVMLAQQQYEIDDPARFYGFGSIKDQQHNALEKINRCITTIKLHYPEVTGQYVADVADQDLLNYWHFIFETYHGLLDKQQASNTALRPVLADLNICVHRCESVARGAEPRHVVTWYGLPKDTVLEEADYTHFTDVWTPGTIFLNYSEIGKTIEHLARDNDLYISNNAFQPFRHYSADFVVRFYEQSQLQAEEKRAIIQEYYDKNQLIFGSWQSCFVSGSVPLADIVGSVPFEEIEARQSVKSVLFT
jgi:hypothetical protein